MKNWGSRLIILCLILIVIVTGCSSNVDNMENKDTDNTTGVHMDKEEDREDELFVPYEPIEFETKVKAYKVNDDLSNIENMEQFGEFTKEQLELLKENNFFVNPTHVEQLFYIYEDNEYKSIPSFITTDSVLQVYHIFYDYTLRNIEEQKLLGMLKELTERMLNNSITVYEEIADENIKDIQLKNIAFFSVAQLCLNKELPQGIPEEAKNIALEELEKIDEHSGFQRSSLFPYDLDYSQFTPRGHYTRSEDFERYFKAMMWYGQAPFPLYFDENGKRNIEQTVQALLITYSLYSDSKSFELWKDIYEPVNFFVGSADDLRPYEYKILLDIYGERPDLNKLMDEEKLNQLYEKAKEFPEPRIKAKYTTVTTPVGKQFRFMGQRYVLDAEIIQELVEPIIRPVPSGLDVMGVLGSDRAEEIQMAKPINQHWEGYPKEFKRLKDEFSKMDDSKWRENMYTGWLWTIKGLLKPYGEGYPSFMTNEAWVDKNLTTALATWAELKHDTILYGKMSGAEMGGGGYITPVGYVEPNIEIYEKLLWLTRYSEKILEAQDMLTESLERKIDDFEDILEFLINCSIKELNNEVLTEEEYTSIMYYGGRLERLSSSFAGDISRWSEITSDTDRNMALIADFHTIAPNQYSSGGYMEAAVGTASEIYVVVPIDGKLYLTRGAVFSYYEFISLERLTDEKWQEMLRKASTSDLQEWVPEWTKSFVRAGKGEIPFPKDW